MAAHDLPRPTREPGPRDVETAAPTGEVAFLFTDLQGSTAAWERAPERMNDVMAEHDRIVRGAIAHHGGTVFSIAGDAFGAAFATAADAARCAVEAQLELHAVDWPDGLAPQVRMGLHVGSAYERDGNYFGPAPNRAARVMSAGHGGQVLASDAAAALLAGAVAGVTVRALGQYLLKDVASPIGIHQLDLAERPLEFPPLRAVDLATRVSRPAGAFIGRDADLAEVVLLLDTSRLVTLVAAGGTGKTRLALEVAAARARTLDRVVVVELADGDRDDVGDRLADAVFGDDPIARVAARTDPVRAVAGHLARERVLVVLDNCEHVLDRAAEVVQALLGAGPGVVVLATSRERLGLPAERVVPLAPLATTAEGGGLSHAAELFVDRALAAHPALTLDEATLRAIDAICVAVDGSALGIELAASRVRTLTPGQIADRLDDALEVLRRNRTTGPERHRSVESAIAWSFDLLTADEGRLLAWSSVFVGGFDLDAAIALGTAAEIDRVLDGVESLVDKSLLTAQQVGTAMRYRLAEPIRQFAAARLDDTGRHEHAVTAHFDLCRARAKTTAALLDGPIDPAAVAALAADVHNFRAAIQRATERGNRKGAMALTASLDLYWAETGNVATAMPLMEQLSRHQPDHSDTALVHVPLLWVAAMAGELPRALEVRDLLQSQLEEGTLSPLSIGGAQFGFGFVDSALGDAAGAARTWADAGAAAAPFAPAIARQAYWSAAQSATAAGDLDGALRLYDLADTLPGPEPGWWPAFVRTMRAVADAYRDDVDVDVTCDVLHDGVSALEHTGLRTRFLLASAFVSLALFHLGDVERATHWWRRSMTAGREVGNLWAAWVMLECAAWSAAEAGDHLTAARYWRTIDTFAAPRGYDQWPLVRDEHHRRVTAAQAVAPEAFAAAAADAPWSLTDAVDHALASGDLRGFPGTGMT
ncbi:MAG: hypothetical protein RL238_3410 [Actinomycetota bacterium]